MRRLYIIVFAVLGMAALIGLFYNFNPLLYSFFPKCPFHSLTGFDCPGCGAQRAIHALLHGDIAGAADHNLLLIISLPFLAIHFTRKLLPAARLSETTQKKIYHPAVPLIIFAAVLIFWIVRNLPFSPFTYLAA